MKKNKVRGYRRYKQDGLENTLTGIGGENDILTYETVSKDRITLDQCDALLSSNGAAGALATYPALRLVQAGFEVDTPDNNEYFQDELDRLEFWTHLQSAIMWGKAYGGAVMLLGIRGTGKLEDEAKVENAKGIDFIRVYDCRDVFKLDRKGNFTYGDDCEYYQIVSPISGNTFIVHKSRIIKFRGAITTGDDRVNNSGWDNSVYVRAISSIMKYTGSVDSAIRALKDINTYTAKIEGIWNSLVAGEDDAIRDRMMEFKWARDAMGLLVYDEDEEINKHTASLSGIKDVFDAIKEDLILNSEGIPARVLFGSQVGGLNNKGEAETHDYISWLEFQSRVNMQPAARYFISFLATGKGITDYKVNFGHLDSMTRLEYAEFYDKMSQGDERYVRNNILSPETIGKARFSATGEVNSNTVVEEKDLDFTPPTENGDNE